MGVCGMSADKFHVIDYADKLVIFSGTYEECSLVQDTQYGGLTIISDADFVKHGTEYFISVYIIPPDKHQVTWTLSIVTPEATIDEEFASATNAMIKAFQWLDVRGYEPAIMNIPFRKKK